MLSKERHQTVTGPVKWHRLAAEQGHASAQYNLGVMYDNGDGVVQDYEPPPVCRRLQSKYGWSLWKKVTEPTDFQLRYAPARFG